MKSIHLVAIGGSSLPSPCERLRPLGDFLFQAFQVPVRVRADTLDAERAWDPERGQYYSTRILRMLQAMVYDDAVVLGVTGLDLFVPVLSFVFGEAQLDGNCALVSFHRLREEFYGMPRREWLLERRLEKEAAHEIGHTFGLRHCLNWECVMASSYGVELLDVKGAAFCASCGRVVRAGQALRAG